MRIQNLKLARSEVRFAFCDMRYELRNTKCVIIIYAKFKSTKKKSYKEF